MTTTLRLTMSQALLRFLDNQYICMDGVESKFVSGIFGIFGHGNVTGIGEALEFSDCSLPYIQGHNEQGMVHAAIAYAKQKNRLAIYACTSSIGPGALNMVTAAATATINRIPVLLLPGDIFACRQPDPVLQQLEVPHDYTISVNDCFKPISKYWDRIERPEQIMTACLNAMRVLTSPADTGAVTLCLPQDVQSESYDYPVDFFRKRIHYIDRMALSNRALSLATQLITQAASPLIIAGGGVHYSDASKILAQFSEQFHIPVAETQAGKSALNWDHAQAVGGIGVTGTRAANLLAKNADVILAIGTRLSDFTTISKSAFNPNATLLHLNINEFDGLKQDGILLHADAKSGLEALQQALSKMNYQTSNTYQMMTQNARSEWMQEVDRVYSISPSHGSSQTNLLGILNNHVTDRDVIVSAAGSLPGDLHRLWRPKHAKSYHLEYGFSCMGYEVAGGLGVKLAEPDKNVYVLVGDGSFLMMHSELLTSVQESKKITVVIFNNHGYQCIHNLQRSHGSNGFGNEFKHRCNQSQKLIGNHLDIDFSKYAEALGARAFHAKNQEDFLSSLNLSKAENKSCVIVADVLPDSMSQGYESWWRVGVASTSTSTEVLNSHHEINEKIKLARAY